MPFEPQNSQGISRSSESDTRAPHRSLRRRTGNSRAGPRSASLLLDRAQQISIPGCGTRASRGLPLLAITGQIPTAQLGTRAFQEVPLEKALGPAAGWSKRLSASDGAQVATDMLNYATTQRDVAHLVIPDDVQMLPPQVEVASGPDTCPQSAATRGGGRQHDRRVAK